MDRLFNIVRNQFIDVIEWRDDSRDTLSFRWPDEDREIKHGAQLIVRESQLVQFVAAGRFADVFVPGKYTLTTENIPILSTLLGWKYGFQSPFKCDVYYLNTRLFTGNRWGTAHPVMMRDPDFGMVRLRAFGTYDFRIIDAPLFLKEVAGTDRHFRIDEFQYTMRSRIVSSLTDALARAHVPVLDVAGRYAEMGEALLPIINPAMRDRYGLEISSFMLENVSVSAEVEQAIDRRGSMRAIGNLNDYVRYQMGRSMESAGAAATMPVQMATGLVMVQEMMHGMRANAGNGPGAMPGVAGSPPGTGVMAGQMPDVAQVAALEVLSPEQAAQWLGVPLADVMTSIASGELRARRIGTTYRIARTALDRFLHG